MSLYYERSKEYYKKKNNCNYIKVEDIDYYSSIGTLDAILGKLDKKFSFVRFGDGELLVMNGWKGKPSQQFVVDDLREQIIKSFQIKHKNYLIGNSAYLTNEKFAKEGLFKKVKKDERLKRISSKNSNVKTFYSPVALHYISVFYPNLFQLFIDAIKHKKIGMVGSKFLKKYKHYFNTKEFVTIPEKQAYQTFNEWYPKVEKMESDLILICAGMSSSIVQKNLWENTNKSSIDLGSVADGYILKKNPDALKFVKPLRTWINMTLRGQREKTG